MQSGAQPIMFRSFFQFLYFSFFLSCTCHAIPFIEDPAISKTEWRACAQFLKKKKSRLLSSRKTRFSTEETGLPFVLEKDPNSKAFLIHLKSSPKGYIGKGWHKTVTKTIFYSKRGRPQLLARCEADKTGFHEIEVLQKVKGIRGIPQLVAFIIRSKKRADLFVEYYQSGSLLRVEKGNLQVQDHELLPVFFDLLYGLKGLHDRGFVHRDLHLGNILLHRTQTSMRAAIVDLGRVIKMNEKGRNGPDLWIARPPEAILRDLSSKDHHKVDIYALGIALHLIAYNRRPSWFWVCDPGHIPLISHKERLERHRKIRELYKQALIDPASGISPIRRDAVRAIYGLLHPNPMKRGSIEKALSNLKQVAEQYGLPTK